MGIFGALGKTLGPGLSAAGRSFGGGFRQEKLNSALLRNQISDRERAKREQEDERNRRVSLLTKLAGGEVSLEDLSSSGLIKTPEDVQAVMQAQEREETKKQERNILSAVGRSDNERGGFIQEVAGKSTAPGAVTQDGLIFDETLGGKGPDFDSVMKAAQRRQPEGIMARLGAQQIESKLNPPAPEPSEFTLSPGQKRFRGTEEVASVPDRQKAGEVGTFQNFGGGLVFNTATGEFEDARAKAGMEDKGSGKNPLSAAQQTKVSDMTTFNEVSTDLLRKLENPALRAELGPISGNWNKFLNDWLGGTGTTETLQDFASDLYNVSDLYLRERTGAAIAPVEFRRAMTQILGDLDTTPEALTVRLRNAIRLNESRIKNIKSVSLVQPLKGKFIKAEQAVPYLKEMMGVDDDTDIDSDDPVLFESGG